MYCYFLSDNHGEIVLGAACLVGDLGDEVTDHGLGEVEHFPDLLGLEAEGFQLCHLVLSGGQVGGNLLVSDLS